MKLKIWEMALLCALVFTVLCGFTFGGDQPELSGKLIRLHVLANSDTEEDQALKLKVRDQVLLEAERLLSGVSEKEEAETILRENLGALNRAAESVISYEGYTYGVTTRLVHEQFPTRDYESFSLPKGAYTSLRVEIGEHRGQNWWCVVFPPLCASAAMEPGTQETMNLTDEEFSLITEENTGYVIKFKAIEIIESIKGWFQD